MNFSPIFSTAVRIDNATDAAKLWLKNDAPILAAAAYVKARHAYYITQIWLEDDAPIIAENIRRISYKTAVKVAAVIYLIIKWATIAYNYIQAHRSEYALFISTAKDKVVAKSQRIVGAAAQLNRSYRVTATLRSVWQNKARITTNALDKVFCLR